MLKHIMNMHNPAYHGLTLCVDVLPALGLKVTEVVKQLDVSRVALSGRLENAIYGGTLR